MAWIVRARGGDGHIEGLEETIGRREAGDSPAPDRRKAPISRDLREG